MTEVDWEYIRENKEGLKNNKWLLVSSLQKSIRRGFFEEAKILWDVTKELDKFYSMYRSSIVAIEDVGLGNQPLVHDFLSTSLKKANLAEKGGDDYIREIIAGLALSVKDRTACDVAWLASNLKWGKSTDDGFLKSFYIDASNDFLDRILAGWLLVGTKKIKHNIIADKDEVSNIENFIKLNRDLGVEEKILEVVSASYVYQKEPHIFAYPLLSLKIKEEKDEMLGKYKTGDVFEKKIEKNIFYHYGIPILASAVDGHTSEGKKIIEVIRNDKNISQYMGGIETETQNYLLKHGLFKIEGQVVDKRLFYPTASNIYKQSQKFYENERFDLGGLMKEMEKLLPEINEMREKALNYSFSRKNYSNFKHK